MGKPKRTSVVFTPFQRKHLEKEKELTGNSIASIVRHAVNNYISEALK